MTPAANERQEFCYVSASNCGFSGLCMPVPGGHGLRRAVHEPIRRFLSASLKR
jgi:hypothetical protein